MKYVYHKKKNKHVLLWRRTLTNFRVYGEIIAQWEAEQLCHLVTQETEHREGGSIVHQASTPLYNSEWL